MKKTVAIKGGVLTIRTAQVTDAVDMINYVKTVACESKNLTISPGEFNITVQQEIEIIERHARSNNSIFLLGFVGDEMVAMLNFLAGSRKRTRHVGELGMSVLKKYWRRGIGEAMLTSLIEWARGTGIIRKINLEVAEYNTAGISLYKKMGFVQEGLLTRTLLVDDKFVDTLLMGLQID